MDSTLLDQIRHLCRDRAAYEHLKAILVQQERVHQLSWEERYENLMTVPTSDSQSSDMLGNIIAREKALAQLADAIQRSPSLELVLQVAVQVAQKLLQVDRVAIFRCHPDGRGEFAIDAIALGLTSIADMPERQLSLARYMIESTAPEHSAQTIDSIRASSLSSHIVTLLEQLGISSYAANKIYAGQEVWGTLVAFHGVAYHSWSESDRTSLSLIAAQIGIAISLTSLRQQSQELTDDLQALRIELDNLQQVVSEIADSNTNSSITPEGFAIDFTQADLCYATIPDDLQSISNIESVLKESGLEEVTVTKIDISKGDIIESNELASPNLENSELKSFDTETVESDILESENSEPKIIDAQPSIPKSLEVADSRLEESAQEISTTEIPELEDTSKQDAIATASEELEVIELSDSEKLDPIEIETIDLETELISPEFAQQEVIEVEINEIENESMVGQIDDAQIDLDTTLALENEDHDDEDPAIEPQFMETILDIAGNDFKATEFLLEVIDAYLEDVPRLVQVIDKAIAISDHVRLLQALNTLRSNSDYIGALNLSHQCRQLESAVKANYVVLIYACLSRVAIEAQRATDALRIARSRYKL